MNSVIAGSAEFCFFKGQLRRLRKMEDDDAKRRWLSKEDGRGGRDAPSTEHQASTNTQATLRKHVGMAMRSVEQDFRRMRKVEDEAKRLRKTAGE